MSTHLSVQMYIVKQLILNEVICKSIIYTFVHYMLDALLIILEANFAHNLVWGPAGNISPVVRLIGIYCDTIELVITVRSS